VFLLLTRHHLGGVVCSLGGKRAGMMPAFCCRQAYNRTLKATFSIHTSPIRLPTESLLESRTEGWVETQQTPFPVRLFLFICATYVLVRWSCCFDRLRRKKKRIRSLVVSTVPLLLFGWLFDRKLDHLRAHLSDFVCVCVCVFLRGVRGCRVVQRRSWFVWVLLFTRFPPLGYATQHFFFLLILSLLASDSFLS
jgi:hypothetical protein